MQHSVDVVNWRRNFENVIEREVAPDFGSEVRTVIQT